MPASPLRTFRKFPVLPLLLLALTLLGAGCQGMSGWFGRWSTSGNHGGADATFATGADRPPTANTLYALARILAARGSDTQCELVLKRVIMEYPKFMPSYGELAALQMRQNRTADAMRTLKMGLEITPEDDVLANNLGMCWTVKGDYGKALEMFSQAAGNVPHNTRYRANMAVALGMMGRYDESLSLFEQVVSASEAHRNLAILCKARNDGARAAQELRKAEALAKAESKKR